MFFTSFFHRFFTSCHVFVEARFRDRFLIAFLMEKGTKMTSKIDPRGDPCDQKGSKRARPRTTGAVPEPTFFRASIFQCFQVPFRRHFGQGSALLAPFWRLLGAFWSPNVPRCTGNDPRATCNAPFWTLLIRIYAKASVGTVIFRNRYKSKHTT